MRPGDRVTDNTSGSTATVIPGTIPGHMRMDWDNSDIISIDIANTEGYWATGVTLISRGNSMRVGDRVVKARRYSVDEYCAFGGDERTVPIGSTGTITDIPIDRINVCFDRGGINWGLDQSELDIEFKIGNRVKLKDYTLYNDYRTHDGQVGVLIHNDFSGDKPWTVEWDDGETSSVSNDNMILQPAPIVTSLSQHLIDKYGAQL